MLDNVWVIGFKIVVFPGKNISGLLHEGAKLRILGRRQMSGYINEFRIGWAPYIMFTDNIFNLYFGRLVGHVIMIEKLL